MKLTFEAENFEDILGQVEEFMSVFHAMASGKYADEYALKVNEPKGSINEETTPVDNSSIVHDQPEGSGLGAQGSNGAAPPEVPQEQPKKYKAKTKKTQEEPKNETEEKPLAPADMIALRQRTIEDLQAAYSGGKQKEVFALLAEHGNGAKSFRELTVEAFLPIRKAIDAGALA